ncbi:MAG: hypothetical protein B6I28_00335 [Fusobacteriia bacterium 4572_132]|nr:MAG: hypothetical protein B6I28_00335 [Fusobacteriia bacterium 4572_132]
MKYNVNFHETFPVTFEYISKILEISNGNRAYTKKEISNITGIPTGLKSGKVVPHIEYAKYMNLINYKKKKDLYVLTRTKLGEEIFVEDPYFTEEITYKILNYFLTSYSIGAEMWSFFYRYLMKSYSGKMTKEILSKEMSKKYGEKVKLAPLLNTYKNNLERLNVLKIEKIKKLEKIEKLENKITIDSTFVYAYCLLNDWEKTFNEVEITSDQLDKMYWKEGFNFSLEEEFNALNLLEENKIIKLNKQLSPLTIIKLKNSEECLKFLYSQLI